jgi:hypothetical protein
MKLLNTILLLTLLVLTAAVPAPQDASSGAVSIPSEQAEANRRGVAFVSNVLIRNACETLTSYLNV